MQPEDQANFPKFSKSASMLFRSAEFETLDSYEENLERYREKDFSYVPIPEADKYYNLNTESLEDLHENQYVEKHLSVRKLFDLLSTYPFLLHDRLSGLEAYVDDDGEYYFKSENPPEDAVKKDLEELEEQHSEIVAEIAKTRYWFVDLADLNRREIREALYPVVAELESKIADAIREDVDEPEDLYHNAPDHVVGRREKDKLRDVGLHTAEYMNLGDMIGLLKGRQHLWGAFGFDDADEVEDRLGSLNQLRNSVMHSNRTLIQSQNDVEKTLERVNDAQRIIMESRGGSLENLRVMWE
ncbi:hypothetical protein ACFQL1_23825 [Halomicroarcula sp. GCM10025709]|uniref:hypothetical protein n=1 Tax=Haloarcula TaxID=2237 RepID=UPI0024C4312E|nr:hypothetical protein [Halomicroarcula sp. YJ-61-S]